MKRILSKLNVLFLLIILLNTASAENFFVYENSEILLEYPSNWNFREVPNSEAGTIIFTEPKWTEENGGAIISYSMLTFPESSTVFNENNKEDFVKGFLESMNYQDVSQLSSEIISINDASSLKIDFTYRVESIDFRSSSIFVADGDRIHTLSYLARSDDFDYYYSTFDKIVTSFRILNPREISTVGYREPTSTEKAKRFGAIFATEILPIIIGLYLVSRLFRKKSSKK